MCVIERVELGNPNGQAEAGYFVRLEHAYGDPAIAARLVGTGTLPVVVRRASL